MASQHSPLMRLLKTFEKRNYKIVTFEKMFLIQIIPIPILTIIMLLPNKELVILVVMLIVA